MRRILCEDAPSLEVARLVETALQLRPGALRHGGHLQLRYGIGLAWRLEIAPEGRVGQLSVRVGGASWHGLPLRKRGGPAAWTALCRCGGWRMDLYWLPGDPLPGCRTCLDLEGLRQTVRTKDSERLRQALRVGAHAEVLGQLLSPREQAVSAMMALEEEGRTRRVLTPAPKWERRRARRGLPSQGGRR
jgi:hypothetical protein